MIETLLVLTPIIIIGSLGVAKIITMSIEKPYDKFSNELK